VVAASTAPSVSSVAFAAPAGADDKGSGLITVGVILKSLLTCCLRRSWKC
jgi:hypothetical protein